MKSLGLVVTVWAAVAACGGRSEADVAAYKETVQQTLAAVAAHRERSQAATTPDACLAEHHRYDAEVRPRVLRMQELSTGMDDCMRSRGRADWADMGGMCSSMTGELDQYQTSACALSDTALDRGETARHCDVMEGYGRRASDRANNAGNCGGVVGGPGMMGGAGMM